MKSKKSVSVPLLMLGTLTIAGCSPVQDIDLKQAHYSSKEECEKSWDEGQCQAPRSVGGGYANTTGYWRSPHYYWDRDINKPVVVYENGNTRVLNTNEVARMGESRASYISSEPALVSKGSGSSSGVSRGSVSRGGFGGGGRASAGG